MNLKFFGASGTVTGSSYFLSDSSQKGILIDFGMFQESSDISKRNNDPLPLHPQDILGVVVTHAHLDHCGRLPILIRMGYHGKVYMTEPTKMLVELALMDAVHIAENNDKPQLYTGDDVYQLLRQVEIIDYDKTFSIENFSIAFRDAGHILGSASIEIFHTQEEKRIVFSGDLGNTPEDLVRPTVLIDSADIVVMESTYGDRTHPQEDTDGILQREINAVEKSGGVLLIPAFSLDRTQEILHKIHHFKKEGLVSEETPVFLDSPMGIQATLIYEHFPQLYNEHLATENQTDKPFRFPGLSLVEEGKESGEIRKITGVKVIIAGSGMMSGGRILRHAEHYLPNVTTGLLLVGYQADGTLGRKIQDGARRVMIEKKSVTVNASVTMIDGMSAHADQPKLINWLKHIKGVKKVFITHGEQDSRLALTKKIQKEIGLQDIALPEVDESFEI